MKFKDYETNPSPRTMLTVAMALGLVLAPFSTPYARPDVPPGKVSSTPVYDYRDYAGPNVSERVFKGSFGNNEFTVIDTMTRLSEPGELEVDRATWDDGAMIRHSVMHFFAGDAEYVWDWTKAYDGNEILYDTSNFDPPLSIRQVDMQKGAMRGGGALNTDTLDSTVSGANRINVALGVDDIVVPYGTISGCLRMFEEHNGYSRISWYCPDIGLAKRVFGSINSPVWELSSVSYSSAP